MYPYIPGCKIYIKEIGGKSLADKEGSLKQGDLVLKINGTSLEGLTLKDARKVVEAAKEKLEFVVRRPDAGDLYLDEGGDGDKNNRSNMDAPPRPPMPWQQNEGKNAYF